MSIKISNLPPAAIANDADVVPIVQGGVTKKAAISLVRPTFGTGPTDVCAGNDCPELTTTGVAALTYGSSSEVGQFTVDDKGRITTAAVVAINPNAIGAVSTSQLAANIATFLSTPTSANLAAALTDEVGTGSVVFASGVTGSGDAVLATTPTVQNPTINGYVEGVTSVTVASNYTISIAASTVIIVQLTSNTPCTFTMPALQAGKSFALYLKQPLTGTPVSTATFTGAVWSGGSAPSLNNTFGRLDIFSFVSDGVKWYGNVSKNYAY